MGKTKAVLKALATKSYVQVSCCCSTCCWRYCWKSVGRWVETLVCTLVSECH
ncbi:hypothetical protein [Enterobacter phage 01_vB_Eclo_IJM]|nr:hypothetical protein [Enterobacter phage 01_vB_Eclo_IJM]